MKSFSQFIEELIPKSGAKPSRSKFTASATHGKDPLKKTGGVKRNELKGRNAVNRGAPKTDELNKASRAEKAEK